MKIAILHGGDIQNLNSTHTARAIYNDYIKKGKKENISIYEIDKDGNIFDNKVKTDIHKIFPILDTVIDTTYDHPKRKEYHMLLHKLNIKVHMHSELDNYEFRKVLSQLGIDHTNHFIIRREDKNIKDLVHEMWRKIHLPVKVRSVRKYLPSVISFNPQEVLDHIMDIQKKQDDVLVDEHSAKKIYNIFSIKDYRGEKEYVSPIVEVFRSNDNSNYVAKYVPATSLTEAQKNKIEKVIRDISIHLDSVINKFDISVDKDNNIKILHISQKPDYFEGRIMYEVFKDFGISFADIIK